jgi:hypothetical protein
MPTGDLKDHMGRYRRGPGVVISGRRVWLIGPGRSCKSIWPLSCPVSAYSAVLVAGRPEAHRERLRALGVEGFRLHDARHHWAVRMARAGAPFELIARQLGHRDVAMVAKVYGRFKPDTKERDRWERIAAGRDREKWPGGVATDVASAEAEPDKQDEQTPASSGPSEGYDDSRGGTRTRDPGIMSAVL